MTQNTESVEHTIDTPSHRDVTKESLPIEQTEVRWVRGKQVGAPLSYS